MRRLLLLQEALELLALLLVEQLLDALLAIREDGAVVLPEIVENRLYLLGLRRGQIQFLLHVIEVQGLGLGRIEGQRALAIVDRQIPGQGAYHRTRQKDQDERGCTRRPGAPESAGRAARAR